jgi:cytidyltransferase-like protein
MKTYRKVAVGGTFDELHRGHEVLIRKAFEVGDKVMIGLSSDAFVSKMGKPHKTASYRARLAELKVFLGEEGLASRAEIVRLDDAYGSTIPGEGLEALVVSEETEVTAERINEKRKQEGLAPLKIVTVCMVQAENSSPISTTRIRKGEIDRNGHMLTSFKF